MSDQSFDDKHTPGPWRVGVDLVHICTHWVDQHGNPTEDNYQRGGWAKSVAKITHSKWADISEHVANAHLIAAAPEMDAALKKCHAELINLVGGGAGERIQELLHEVDTVLRRTRRGVL